MSAARQGSYLHVVGEPALIAEVASTICGRHTTSPSIPILASLDLARAHAQSHGQGLLQRCLDLAAGARQVVNDDPALSAYQRLPEPAPAGTNRHYVTADPTKLLIGTTGLRRSGEDVRLRLFHDYGIYLSRTLPDAFLVNFHIGIAAEDVELLLQSLRSLAHRTRRRLGGTRANLGTEDDGTPIDRLLIAYPPGVPFAVPANCGPTPCDNASRPADAAEPWSTSCPGPIPPSPRARLMTRSAPATRRAPAAGTRSQATSRHGLPGGSTASGCREQIHLHPRPRARAGHRRRGWATAQDWDTAAARSATQGDQMPKETRWHRMRTVRATRCVPRSVTIREDSSQ